MLGPERTTESCDGSIELRGPMLFRAEAALRWEGELSFLICLFSFSPTSNQQEPSNALVEGEKQVITSVDQCESRFS